MTNQRKAGIKIKRDCLLGSGGWNESKSCPVSSEFDDGDNKCVLFNKDCNGGSLGVVI